MNAVKVAGSLHHIQFLTFNNMFGRIDLVTSQLKVVVLTFCAELLRLRNNNNTHFFAVVVLPAIERRSEKKYALFFHYCDIHNKPPKSAPEIKEEKQLGHTKSDVFLLPNMSSCYRKKKVC
jgi:hypothetical protein